MKKWFTIATHCSCKFFVSIVIGIVPTTPEKFENAALFLRSGLQSTLIHHENEAFRKRSLNRTNLKTPAFRFRVDGKHFENGAFP